MLTNYFLSLLHRNYKHFRGVKIILRIKISIYLKFKLFKLNKCFGDINFHMVYFQIVSLDSKTYNVGIAITQNLIIYIMTIKNVTGLVVNIYKNITWYPQGPLSIKFLFSLFLKELVKYIFKFFFVWMIETYLVLFQVSRLLSTTKWSYSNWRINSACWAGISGIAYQNQKVISCLYFWQNCQSISYSK